MGIIHIRNGYFSSKWRFFMNYKRLLLIVGLFSAQSAVIGHMQPVKDEQGCYHYDENDTHLHVDLKKALSILGSKILAPQKLIKGIVSRFYSPEKKEKIDPIALLNPTQTVPA